MAAEAMACTCVSESHVWVLIGHAYLHGLHWQRDAKHNTRDNIEKTRKHQG